MDPTALANSLNILVVLSLFVLAIALLLVTLPLVSLIDQSRRTLSSAERLTDTLERELGPTLKEVESVLGGVRELKHIAEQRMVDVGTKVEDVTENLNKVTTSAKKNTSVWGAGLFAGIQAYLEGKEGGPKALTRDAAAKDQG